jgi:predicted DNA-binding transcriptional regulator YafY
MISWFSDHLLADDQVLAQPRRTLPWMGKSKKPQLNSRTDAERRIRQSERLGRLLRTLRLIAGPGRWDADALARELELSRRSVHRILQTLSLAGVPWSYDADARCYRVPRGFKFPGLAIDNESKVADVAQLRTMIEKLSKDLAATSETLRRFTEDLNQLAEAQRDTNSPTKHRP